MKSHSGNLLKLKLKMKTSKKIGGGALFMFECL